MPEVERFKAFSTLDVGLWAERQREIERQFCTTLLQGFFIPYNMPVDPGARCPPFLPPHFPILRDVLPRALRVDTRQATRV